MDEAPVHESVVLKTGVRPVKLWMVGATFLSSGGKLLEPVR